MASLSHTLEDIEQADPDMPNFGVSAVTRTIPKRGKDRHNPLARPASYQRPRVQDITEEKDTEIEEELETPGAPVIVKIKVPHSMSANAQPDVQSPAEEEPDPMSEPSIDEPLSMSLPEMIRMLPVIEPTQ